MLGQSLEGGWEMVLAEARTLESGHGIASLDEWTSNTADLHQDYPIKFNTPAQVKRPFRPFQPAGVPAGYWCVTPLVLSDILDISGLVGWLVGWLGVIVNLGGERTQKQPFWPPRSLLALPPTSHKYTASWNTSITTEYTSHPDHHQEDSAY